MGLLIGFTTVAFARRSLKPVFGPLALILGSGAGILIIALQTYFVSGELTQSSVRVKSFWTSLLGPDIDFVRYLLSELRPSVATEVGNHLYRWPFTIPTVFIVVAIAALAALSLRSRMTTRVSLWENLSTLDVAMLVGGLASTLLYFFVYTQNAAAQLWYAASFLVPLSLYTASASKMMFGRLSGLVAILSLAISVDSVSNRLIELPYPWQREMAAIAEVLNATPVDGRIGAWNSGIYAYLVDAPVSNLDGLVNDAIVPYIMGDTTSQFLLRENIRFIVDYRGAFSDQSAWRMFGLGNGSLAQCVVAVPQALSDTSRATYPELFRIIPECLARESAVPRVGNSELPPR